MSRFKSLIHHLIHHLKPAITAVAASTILAACTLPKSSSSADGKNANATFFVSSSDINVTTQKLDPKISIPIAKTFSFKVCVRDNRMSQTIINHHFQIQTEDKPLEQTTDANGCLVWSEDIAYNHLAPAHNLELVRTLKAVGFQKGERSVSFAINPWENYAESLLEKKRTDLIPYQDLTMTLQGAKDKNSAGTSRPVWVDDLRLTVYEKQVSSQGMTLNFMIRTSPSVVLISSTGSRILQPLTYGEFDTEVSLIHVVSENQKQVRRLLATPVQTTGIMAEGYLSIEAPITLDKICTRGQVEIGLKLTPKNAPKNLLPFEGVFVGGDCDQIKGSSFNRLTNVFQEAKGAMTIAQYLTDKTVPGAATTVGDMATDEYYQPGKIIILPLTINSTGYLDQHTIDRVRLFRVTACMSGPLDLKSLRNQSFKVTKVNGTVADVTTNLQGCLFWDDSYKFNFLENESWREASIRIANQNLGLDQNLKIHINPWGLSDITAFRDIRNFDPQGQTLYAAKGHSQIILNSYSYDKVSYDYAMDPTMGLTMKKNVLLKLNPRIKRPSLTDPSGFAEEPLPIGAYALRWAVVDMSVDDLSQARDKILQADERIVFLNANSTIAETLTLQTTDIKEIGSTNKLFIELYPLKENAQELLRQNPKLSLDDVSDTTLQLPHSIYWGSVTLANNNEGTALVPYKDTLISLFPKLKNQFLFDQSTRLAKAQELARKEKFAYDNSLVSFNLSDTTSSLNLRANLNYSHLYSYNAGKAKKADTIPYSEEKVREWLRTGTMDSDLMNKMCDLFTNEILRNPRNTKNVFSQRNAAQISELCQAGAEKQFLNAFDIQYRYFVKNPKLLKTSAPEMRDAQIGAGFSFNRGVTNSFTKSANFSMSVSAKAEVPGLSFLSGSMGSTYSISKSHSENNGFGAQQVFSTGVSLALEKVQATIQVDSYEKCAVVKLSPIFFENDQEKKASVAPSFMQKISNTLFGKFTMLDLAEPTATEEDYNRTISKGIMVCDGNTAKRPTTLVENYYVLNQRMPYTLIVDPASDESRPFFVALRGDADFDRFMTYLEGSYTNPATGTAEDVNKEMISNHMRGLFMYMPTYPGQIVREH